MEDNYIEVLTPAQAKFHLLNNEIVCFDFKGGSGYFTLQKNNQVSVQLIKKFGRTTEFTGDLDKFEDIAQLLCKGENLYVYKGGSIQKRKANIIDRIVNWFNDLRESE